MNKIKNEQIMKETTNKMMSIFIEEALPKIINNIEDYSMVILSILASLMMTILLNFAKSIDDNQDTIEMVFKESLIAVNNIVIHTFNENKKKENIDLH